MTLQSKNILYIFLFVVAFISLYFWINGFSSSPQNTAADFIAKNANLGLYSEVPREKKIEKVQKCYISIFDEWKKNGSPLAWLELANLVKLCSAGILNYLPFFETTPFNPEHKYYMIPNLSMINDTCSIITFGIGGDIESEEHMQRALPHCHFLGFDPNENYGGLFTKNLKGKFVKTAVGGKNEKATILKLAEGTANFKPTPGMEIRAAADMIKTYHGADKPVDIWNIDVEGSEYGIFEQISKDKIFQNVCQLNVEFHPMWYNPSTGHSFIDIINILKNLVEEGTFVWVRSVVHSSQFFPSYFVNVKNEYCIEKYLKNRLF